MFAGCRVVATMATIPDRRSCFPQAVDSLLASPLIDDVVVYFNGPRTAALPMGRRVSFMFAGSQLGDLGDAGKFAAAALLGPCFVLTCDDDLAYPRDYVETMLSGVLRYDRGAVVAAHGSRLFSEDQRGGSPFNNYFRERAVYHYAADVAADLAVHVVGTGTAAFWAPVFKPSLGLVDFPSHFMADLHLATAARRRGVPLVVLQHRRQWLTDLASGEGATLFDRYRRAAAAQTEIVNRQRPWADPIDLETARLELLRRGEVRATFGGG